MLHIPRCLAAMARLTSDQAARYSMTGLRLQELAGDPEQAEVCFRLEATDGRVAGVARGPSTPGPRDCVVLPAAADPAVEAVIPAAEFKQAMALGTGHLAVVLGQKEVVLASGSSLIRCQPVEGRFPPVDAVLPGTPALVSFTLNADLLMDLLTAAKAVAMTMTGVNKRDKPLPLVTLLYFGRGKPVGVTSRGQAGLTFDGIIMPLLVPSS